jgi:hypothetical protein
MYLSICVYIYVLYINTHQYLGFPSTWTGTLTICRGYLEGLGISIYDLLIVIVRTIALGLFLVWPTNTRTIQGLASYVGHAQRYMTGYMANKRYCADLASDRYHTYHVASYVYIHIHIIIYHYISHRYSHLRAIPIMLQWRQLHPLQTCQQLRSAELPVAWVLPPTSASQTYHLENSRGDNSEILIDHSRLKPQTMHLKKDVRH